MSDGDADAFWKDRRTVTAAPARNMIAVSYTHLDVYKRQGQHHDKWGTLELHDYSRASNLCPGLYRVPDGLRIGNVGDAADSCFFDYMR